MKILTIVSYRRMGVRIFNFPSIVIAEKRAGCVAALVRINKRTSMLGY
jgi:hypothetical protein